MPAEEKVFHGPVYECARCGTRVTGEELAKLPSPTCANCGYRTFKKVRTRAPRSLKAE